MTEMQQDRRGFLGAVGFAGLVAALPQAARANMPDLSRVPVSTADKVEILFKTPHYGANGMWMSDEGLWIIHQIDENYASLIDINNGRLIREVQTEGVVRASGICVDEQGVMWIGSTYNRLIVSCDARTGKAIAKYSTPGAGQIYSVKGDQRGTRTPLQPAYPQPVQAPPAPGERRPSGRQGAGKQDMSVVEGPVGTGAHCLLPKGNLLYVDVPPARAIFAIDKASWQVQHFYPTAGDRPHDMAWADAGKTRLWCSDSNMNAFFLHDAESGNILRRVNLPAGSPTIHGAKLHNGYMYMCDDVGWLSRVRFDFTA